MFHAILKRRIDLRGFEFDVELLDVQELNAALETERFDFSKASTVAAITASESYEIIPAGSAVGYGVGPLLLSRPGAMPVASGRARILLPGELTTAAMLFKRFFPESREISYAIFSEIMPALQAARADYGVVIHEGRFTYQEKGLQLEADLGALWEHEYQVPLPLGCIVSRRAVDRERQQLFTELLRDSIRYAYENRDEVLVTMRHFAQELSDGVIWAHVDLYVNEWSVDLGATGMEAMRCFRSVVDALRS
jgi:1,4-dihydroxy-6-naphthoate synthase